MPIRSRYGSHGTTATVGELLEKWLAHGPPGFSSKCVLETRDVLDRNLSPNRGLPGGLIRIDLAGLRSAGCEIQIRWATLAFGARG